MHYFKKFKDSDHYNKLKDIKRFVSSYKFLIFFSLFVIIAVSIRFLSLGIIKAYSQYLEDKNIFIFGDRRQSPQRPLYYNQEKKQFSLKNIMIPISLKERNSKVQFIEINITLLASNRYIKNFFSTRSYYLLDLINGIITPVPKIFLSSLIEQAKLKDKIKIWLNLLLKKLKIKGSIEKVHINLLLQRS